MKILLHACCAPCSLKCIESLAADGFNPVLFWYNPNIHPYTEYANRRDCLVRYAETTGLPLVLRGTYALRDFIAGIYPDLGKSRCAFCYDIRLEETARYAAENGFDYFSTTLLISPYQDHTLIKETASRAAKKYGLNFVCRDFRPLFRDGQRAAREAGLYMQKYCGCVFSEEERYNASRD